MEVLFENQKIQDEYYNSRYIQKKYGYIFSVGLEKMLGAIDAATCAYDIKVLPQFRMHLLKGNLKGFYSLSPDNKKTKWRVPAKCLDESNKERVPDNNEAKLLKETKKLRLYKIGDYHD